MVAAHTFLLILSKQATLLWCTYLQMYQMSATVLLLLDSIQKGDAKMPGLLMTNGFFSLKRLVRTDSFRLLRG